MIVVKTYKFRLEPAPEQQTQFAQFAGCRRYVWNWALARKQEIYKETGKTLPYVDLAKEVDRFFPSSKKCHCCPHTQHLELSDRQWTCENCHTVHDRDINAAINMLVEGLRLLAQSSQVKLALGMRESLSAKGGNVRLAKVSSSR